MIQQLQHHNRDGSAVGSRGTSTINAASRSPVSRVTEVARGAVCLRAS